MQRERLAATGRRRKEPMMAYTVYPYWVYYYPRPILPPPVVYYTPWPVYYYW